MPVQPLPKERNSDVRSIDEDGSGGEDDDDEAQDDDQDDEENPWE